MEMLITILVVVGGLLAIGAGIMIYERRQRAAEERRQRAIEYLRKQRDREMESEMRRKLRQQQNSTTAVRPSTSTPSTARSFTGSSVQRTQPATVVDDGPDLLTNVLIYDALFNQRPAPTVVIPEPYISGGGGDGAGGGASSSWEPAPQPAPEPDYTCRASDYRDSTPEPSYSSSSYDSGSSDSGSSD